MTKVERYYAAACQLDMPNPASRDEIQPRVTTMLQMIDHAVVGYQPFFDVKLVVFPEFAHAAPIYHTTEQLLETLAVVIPNEFTDQYQRKAQDLGIYVQTGSFLEKDEQWPGHVFNTTCLIGPEGMLYRYRKVHTWIPWEVHTSPHDLSGYREPLFPVAETSIGKIGCAICYDWLFPEAIRQLALQGAQVLVRVSAYMDPWGSTAHVLWKIWPTWLLLIRHAHSLIIHRLVGPVAACWLTLMAAFSLRQTPAQERKLSWVQSIWRPCVLNVRDGRDITCWHTCVKRCIQGKRIQFIPPLRPTMRCQAFCGMNVIFSKGARHISPIEEMRSIAVILVITEAPFYDCQNATTKARRQKLGPPATMYHPSHRSTWRTRTIQFVMPTTANSSCRDTIP